MFRLIASRILQAIPTLLVLITISFFLMHVAPGNPFSSDKVYPPEVMANINAKYGLDKPVFIQYLNYLYGLLQWDFGPSFVYKDISVNQLIAQSFPISVKIGVIAFAIVVFIGIGIGIVAAIKQNTWIDYVIMTFAMVGVVVPSFILAPLSVLIFAIFLKWLPSGGYNDGGLKFMILPVITLGIGYIASIARLTRSSMIEVLNASFIRTAKAKGLNMKYIIIHHALKPSLIPVVSYLGPAFVGIITGSVVIETVFGIPGIGQLFVNGALNRDYSLVLSLTILVGALAIAFNTIVDIIYTILDPKISTK
ncbi:MAG: oligopeptide ABC transporter permease OppB [Helicobacter sp.]|nr:oligopeptide ABC transporter permease OppB [Helicobacter sp.]